MKLNAEEGSLTCTLHWSGWKWRSWPSSSCFRHPAAPRQPRIRKTSECWTARRISKYRRWKEGLSSFSGCKSNSGGVCYWRIWPRNALPKPAPWSKWMSFDRCKPPAMNKLLCNRRISGRRCHVVEGTRRASAESAGEWPRRGRRCPIWRGLSVTWKSNSPGWKCDVSTRPRGTGDCLLCRRGKWFRVSKDPWGHRRDRGDGGHRDRLPPPCTKHPSPWGSSDHLHMLWGKETCQTCSEGRSEIPWQETAPTFCCRLGAKKMLPVMPWFPIYKIYN